jgi:NADPH:quinone reductase-like Zn-dependent oxidoreductase
MRGIHYHRYGGPELMRLEEVEPAAPGKVRVRAAAANPIDWMIRNGDTKLMTGRRFPRGLGHDFAVAGAGEGVSRFEVALRCSAR